MNKFLGSVTAVALFALAPLTVNAVALTPPQLDPGLGQNGSFVQVVCAVGTTCPASSSGPTTFTFEIINNSGIINASSNNSISPNASGSFSVFNYTIFRPDATVLGTGTGFGNNNLLPVDASVDPGIYSVTVNWTYLSTNSTSVNWSMLITTAPKPTPEPGTLALLGLGLVGLGVSRRVRRQS